jgi:hypothetical protein
MVTATLARDRHDTSQDVGDETIDSAGQLVC